VTIADTLYDAANDIRGYVEDDGLEHITAWHLIFWGIIRLPP
jgi:hypothetical protein